MRVNAIDPDPSEHVTNIKIRKNMMKPYIVREFRTHYNLWLRFFLYHLKSDPDVVYTASFTKHKNIKHTKQISSDTAVGGYTSSQSNRNNHHTITSLVYINHHAIKNKKIIHWYAARIK